MTFSIIETRKTAAEARQIIDEKLGKSEKTAHRVLANFLESVIDEMGDLAEGATLNLSVSGSTGSHGVSISGSISKSL